MKVSQSGGEDHESQNSFMGFVAVLAASATSGYAGVYFEKQLKVRRDRAQLLVG